MYKIICTYEEAIKNLQNNIIKYCSNSSYLTEEILKLSNEVMNSDVRKLRF